MPSDNDLQRMGDAVIVALGSNLSGDYASPIHLLEAALQTLPRFGVQVVHRSGWWRSAAWPDAGDPAFINAVALVETQMEPQDALSALHAVEAQFGRRRHERNAPRTLDLDLIAFGRRQSDDPMLPHPRAHERAFVMRPLAQIAPEWRHPTLGSTARDLARAATIGADACIVDL